MDQYFRAGERQRACPTQGAAPRTKRHLGLFVAVAVAWLTPSQASAHATERAFVLLLPTEYYLLGGTIAVAATFAALRFIPAGVLARAFAARLPLARFALPDLSAFRVIAAAIAVGLLIVGWFGPRDPLENALTISVWTLIWVGLTIAHAFLGNIWALFNPLLGAYRAAAWILARTGLAAKPGHADLSGFIPYPDRLGHWPAIAGFFCFAWFELVYPAPEDPDVLANAIALYAAFNLACMAVFGPRRWLEQGEAFTLFYRLVAGLSPIVIERQTDRPRQIAMSLAMPGAALIANAPKRFDFAVFVLLSLASVSFDGLGKTFAWLSAAGVNPLEFPGRSAMMIWNTWGLLAVFAGLGMLYFTAQILGRSLGGKTSEGWPYRATVSLVPISLGFHFAHYLTAFLINVQYAKPAFADPFGWGWSLLPITDMHVTASFLNNLDDVSLIWNAQAFAVVIGHVLAVVLAAALASDIEDQRALWRAESPLACVMIAYTSFGLWLLSTPVVG